MLCSEDMSVKVVNYLKFWIQNVQVISSNSLLFLELNYIRISKFRGNLVVRGHRQTVCDPDPLKLELLDVIQQAMYIPYSHVSYIYLNSFDIVVRNILSRRLWLLRSFHILCQRIMGSHNGATHPGNYTWIVSCLYYQFKKINLLLLLTRKTN